MERQHVATRTRLIGTRRRALSGLVAAGVAALLGWAAGPETAAKPARRCPRRQKRCRRRCIAKRKCCRHAECGPAGQCLRNGSCAAVCGAGISECPAPSCACGGASTEGDQRCIRADLPCAETTTKACTSTAECPRGYHCQQTDCTASGQPETRCVLLCGYGPGFP